MSVQGGIIQLNTNDDLRQGQQFMKKNLARFSGVLVLTFLCVIAITLFVCRTPFSELAQDPTYNQTLSSQIWSVKIAVVFSFFMSVMLVAAPVCAVHFVLSKKRDRKIRLYKQCPYCLGNIVSQVVKCRYFYPDHVY